MNILLKIREIVKNAFSSGWSAEKLTLSFCMGVYIAFSPFPGAHTVMMFIAKWLFGLNFPVLFMATSINNPWTIIPFFSFDYVFGYWFVHKFLGLNPSFVIPLEKILGSGKICLWSFLIGGNILGIVSALICYPFVNIIFKKLVTRFKEKEIQEL